MPVEIHQNVFACGFELQVKLVRWIKNPSYEVIPDLLYTRSVGSFKQGIGDTKAFVDSSLLLRLDRCEWQVTLARKVECELGRAG